MTRPFRLPSFWSLALVAILALFFGALLDPRRAFAVRDMLEFHLPLRFVWTKLATISFFPQWDPFAHGGQPLLSNPNYQALYPPSWVALLVPATVAVSFLTLLHAAVAAWGAERLARRLGADRPGALLAAIAFSCGPTYLSVLHSLTLAYSLSWLPWVLVFAIARVEVAEARPPNEVRPFAGLARSTTMAVLAGNPDVLAMTAIALPLLCWGPASDLWRRLRRLAGPLALGIGLAAAHLLPTLARLADSPRAGGLDWSQATKWSLPWQRLPELFFPTFYGDSARPMTGLYFGWGIHDRDFPYLVLIAVGTPLVLLAIAEWTRPRAPWRAPLSCLAFAGLFLALGRHNPLYRLLWEWVPGVASIRYPEKFALLTLAALIFAGALGWKRLLDERDRGPARLAELPAALALLLVLVAAFFAWLAHRAPALIESFLRSHSGWPLTPAGLARAAAYLRNESLFALAIALSCFVLFALARWSRLPRRALELGAVVVVVSELWVQGAPLVRTLPASDYLAPPPVARQLLAGPGRLFSNAAYRDGRPEVVLNAGNVIDNWARASLDRLHARTANLLGKAYALDGDFDLALTRAAARAVSFYDRLRLEPDLAHRLLGAWGVEQLLIGRAAEELLDEIRRGTERPPQVRVAASSYYLPQVRFLSRYRAFASATLAEEAAVASRVPLNVEEFLIGVAPHSSALALGRLLGDEDEGDRRRIEYESQGPTLLVVAATFDRSWKARLDGDVNRDLPLFETAGGYIAALVPAGRHHVELVFRDRWFAIGALVSAFSAILGLASSRRTIRTL